MRPTSTSSRRPGHCDPRRLGTGRGPPPWRSHCGQAPGFAGEQALALFDAQIGNRHLDLAARYLRAASQGLSMGHEANPGWRAVALRPTRAGRKSECLARNLRRG